MSFGDCRADCTLPVCGDGVVTPGDLCFGQAQTLTALPGTLTNAFDIGDMNNDGVLDILSGHRLGNAGNGNNKLLSFLGNGDGSFAPPLEVISQNTCAEPSLFDLNRDGALDILSANIDDSVGVLQLGNGDGTFGASLFPISAAGFTEDINAADVDNDGDLDIMLTGSTTIAFNSNLGDGTFTPAVTLDLNVNPFRILTADFDQDGKVDVALSTIDSRIVVLRNTGSFTFTEEALTTSLAVIGDFAIADFDLDGSLDIAAGMDTNLDIFFGNGDGTFDAAQVVPLTGFTAQNASAADFNLDGVVDLVLSSPNTDQVVVLFGQGDGSFGEARTFAVGDAPQKVKAADLNQDGLFDIVVANAQSDTLSVILSAP